MNPFPKKIKIFPIPPTMMKMVALLINMVNPSFAEVQKFCPSSAICVKAALKLSLKIYLEINLMQLSKH